MEIVKRKYKQAEVIEILNACKNEYEEKLKEQKGRIIELTKENSQLVSQLEGYKEKEALVAKTMQRAEKNAQKMKDKIDLQYSLEIERLRVFAQKWENYFNLLKEKYPVYGPVIDAIDIKEKLASVLRLSDTHKALDKLNKTLADKGIVDQKVNSSEYVATSDNGFNLDEVLNPGELELEDLCKELGLLDE